MKNNVILNRELQHGFVMGYLSQIETGKFDIKIRSTVRAFPDYEAKFKGDFKEAVIFFVKKIDEMSEDNKTNKG